MSNILVTGGLGFIGSHIVDELINLKHDVYVVDNLSGGSTNNINRKSHFYQMTVNDKRQMSWMFVDYKFEYVFHLAAYAAEGLSHFIRNFNYTNNVVGSMNIINECIKHEAKLIFFSSIACYGDAEPPFTEETQPQPIDPYGIAKYATELDIIAANKMFGLDYIIFRPYNIYGPRQRLNDKYRNVLGIFINQILSDKPLTVFGDGTQTRAFSFIGDIAPKIAQSAFKPEMYNKTFNIGAEKTYSVNDIAEMVKRAMGSHQQIMHVKARNEVHNAYCSIDKIKKHFPSINKTQIWDGINKMVEWANTQEIEESKEFTNIEVYKNLPTIWK